MSDGVLARPGCIPQEAWDQSGPAARACFVVLVARIEELERRLGMNSGNSSMPPSSDGPGQQPVTGDRPKSGKKRGGQFGHLKRERPLIPTEQCDRIVHHRPTECSGCGDAGVL